MVHSDLGAINSKLNALNLSLAWFKTGSNDDEYIFILFSPYVRPLLTIFFILIKYKTEKKNLKKIKNVIGACKYSFYSSEAFFLNEPLNISPNDSIKFQYKFLEWF